MPYRAFRRNLIASNLVPVGVALALLVAVVLWQIHGQASVFHWIEHSYEVILGAKDAELELRKVQLASRQYLLSRDRRYLTQADDAQKNFKKNLASLAGLVADDPDRERRLPEIDDLKETWLKGNERLIGQDEGTPVSPQALAQVQDQAEAVCKALENFVAAEQRLQARRAAVQILGYQGAFVLVPLLAVLVMAFVGYWGWRQIQRATQELRNALENAQRARVEAEEAGSRAEKATRTKDVFLGTVSHELRNPLNSIMLWATALLHDPTLSDSARRGITAIERAVRVQAQLIEDLLDISRIESGRLRLDVQEVDLAEVVKAGVDSLRVAAEAKAIVLREAIDPRIPRIAGDPGRLQQVVWNLVSNAVKFTPRGGRVEVRLERVDSHAEVIVADTGVGVEPAALALVFERFWQANGSGQSRDGIGLGLSIVREIVGLHGGTVSVHSAGSGKGSRFTVRLPLPVSAIPSYEARAHPTVDRVADVADAPRLDGYSILVVDDDPGACEALKNLLGSLGASVTAAASASTALALIDETHPDAIVSDIGMPIHDGYFLAGELRRRERGAGRNDRAPMIALTAYGRVEDKIKILTAGFDSHAVKPVDPVELATILQTLITSRVE